MANYDLTDRAREDLDDIYTYGIRQWGLHQADIYYDKLLDALDRISAHPERYQIVDEIDRNVRRHVVKSHVVYYEAKDDRAIILAILRSQNPNRIR